jgi:hypothetical protein
MDWADFYRNTVRHMLPSAQPYADLLRRFVLTNREPIATWIVEAQAMLEGYGRIREESDLTMLAAMVERGTLAMLPAVAMSGMIEQAIAANGREIAIGTIGHGGFVMMQPLDQESAEDLVRTLTTAIVGHAMRAVNWLSLTAANAVAPTGSRVDMTADAARMRIDPVCAMAATVVLGAVPVARLADLLRERAAA